MRFDIVTIGSGDGGKNDRPRRLQASAGQVDRTSGRGVREVLDPTFDNRVDVLDVAADVARRCATHRLSHDSSSAVDATASYVSWH